MTAEMIMFIGGCGALLVTLQWVRNRVLREKYAIGWIALALVLFVVGLFPSMLKSFAEWAHLSYPAAIMLFSLGIIYCFSFSVSISLSRLYRKNLKLNQSISLLEERVRKLESDKDKRE
jgi:hypothetical protein